VDNRVLKVFVASALGAGIGSLTALSVHPYLWWIGMIVGGLIGYLTYDFKQVIQDVPIAWNATWRMFVSPIWKVVRGAMLVFAVIFLVGVSFAASLFLAFLLLYIFYPMEGVSFVNGWGGSGIAFGGVSMFVGFGIGIALLIVEIKDSGTFEPEEIKYILKLAAFLSPPGIVVMAIWGIVLLVIKTPTIIRFLALFAKNLFLLIHSDIRLLCGVDAALGAVAGFFLLNPILGALIGGVIGVLNYKLISQRILHLEPR